MISIITLFSWIISLLVIISNLMGFLSSFLGPIFGAAGSIANIVAPGVGGAIAGVLGNAVSSGFNQYNDNKSIDKYNQGQLDLAKYVADRNEGFWDLQNNYNTPKKQMQRYLEAGLNPNLIYGQISNGNASAVQAFPMPSQERKQYKATVNAALGLQLQNAAADTKVKEAQANRLNADADLIRSRQTGQDTENTLKGYLVGPARLKFEAIMDGADTYKEAVTDKEIYRPIVDFEAVVKRNRILEVSALVAEYMYEHGSHKIQLQAQQYLRDIRKYETNIKKNMSAWSDMGVNPNTDGFIIRQLGTILKDHNFSSFSEVLSYVIDNYF